MPDQHQDVYHFVLESADSETKAHFDPNRRPHCCTRKQMVQIPTTSWLVLCTRHLMGRRRRDSMRGFHSPLRDGMSTSICAFHRNRSSAQLAHVRPPVRTEGYITSRG